MLLTKLFRMALRGKLVGAKSPCHWFKKNIFPLKSTATASKAKNIFSYIQNNANAWMSIGHKEIEVRADHGNAKFIQTVRPDLSQSVRKISTRRQPKTCVQNNRHCWRGSLLVINVRFCPQDNRSAKLPHSPAKNSATGAIWPLCKPLKYIQNFNTRISIYAIISS